MMFAQGSLKMEAFRQGRTFDNVSFSNIFILMLSLEIFYQFLTATSVNEFV